MAAMTAQQRQLYLSDLMAGQGDPENQAVLDQVPMSSLIGRIPGNYGPGQGAFQRAGGPVVNLQSSPATTEQQLDYSQPLDFMGTKGYRLKGDSNRVLLNDGRMVTLDATAQLEQAARQRQAQMQMLDMQGKQADIAAKTAPNWHIDSASGMMINTKSGEMKPIGAGGAGGSVKSREDAATRTREAQDAIDLAEEAKKYVGTAPGSYIGAAGNIAGKALGFDTDATKAQAKLGVLGGALVSKMPKMSGPQSDKDVALYKQMAGNLDDPTVPASAKLAAIETIQQLNRKYAGADYQPAGIGSPALSGKGESAAKIADDAGYNALPSGATFIGPDGKTRRKP